MHDANTMMSSVRAAPQQRGLTLIELMIAITISLVVLAALTAMFVTSSRARDEIARSNQQIENGRYAMQVLSEDIRLAGYMGMADLRTPLALSDPGAPPTMAAAPVLSFASNRLCGADDVNTGMEELRQQAPLYIEGANNVGAVPGDCSIAGNFVGGTAADTMGNFRAGSDILVIRRTSSCAAYPPPTTCPPIVNAPYFQVSMCPASAPDQAVPHIATLGVRYMMEACPANCDTSRPALEAVFVLNNKAIASGNCSGAANNAEVRRFLTHIYYVANFDHDNDPATALLPTLMRAELVVDPGDGNRKFEVFPIAEGIDQIQVQYGVDSAGNDGVPDSYEDAGSAALNSVADWQNVMTAKLHILARSSDPSPGYTDTKIYTLGVQSDGDPECALDANNDGVCEAIGGNFKRHVFETLVELKNPAGYRK